MESLREPRWIPTLAASYLGQNFSLLIQPGKAPNEVRCEGTRRGNWHAHEHAWWNGVAQCASAMSLLIPQAVDGCA